VLKPVELLADTPAKTSQQLIGTDGRIINTLLAVSEHNTDIVTQTALFFVGHYFYKSGRISRLRYTEQWLPFQTFPSKRLSTMLVARWRD
jgi:hypothetical protein